MVSTTRISSTIDSSKSTLASFDTHDTFDEGDTNLVTASYEHPPSPSENMPTHESTSPLPTPSCQPSNPSSPPLKDPLEMTLQQLVQENLIELPPITYFEEIYFKPHWYKDDEYYAYHRCKGHLISTCTHFKRVIKNLEYCGKIGLDKTNSSNPLILPSSPSPSPYNTTIHLTSPNPISLLPNTNHEPSAPINPPPTKDVIQGLLARVDLELSMVLDILVVETIDRLVNGLDEEMK